MALEFLCAEVYVPTTSVKCCEVVCTNRTISMSVLVLTESSAHHGRGKTSISQVTVAISDWNGRTKKNKSGRSTPDIPGRSHCCPSLHTVRFSLNDLPAQSELPNLEHRITIHDSVD